MTPDRYEDIEFEMNHELGNAEAREINRRVEHARAARRQPEPDLPEFDEDEIAEGRLRAMDYDAWADL